MCRARSLLCRQAAERGIKGNSHFLTADLNNKEIADIAAQ
ncbi:hypothetical protein HMPREF9555_00475 [Selenomonas artemidis F0399]|uniref:Uncharacterized protein n=1 Tax=Selenomonas artemidis F0399 TaxID=749551 RepID=E7N0H5_9FIRM|nr:hypothetical protein HMPREF9555_00475 [Selenomonas artemidis F0399]